MKKIKLSIANANGNFSDKQIATFYNDTDLAEKFISDNFDFDYEVDVIVTPESYLHKLIPEDGISGRTYRSDLIIISVNTQSSTAHDFFFETLCHELSHSVRWNKVPEYSKNLFDDIILEGLAILLEEKALIDNCIEKKQFFLKEIQSTSHKTIDAISKRLDGLLTKDDYDYEKIFISGDREIPRWAGYKIGYFYAKKYLLSNNCDINTATLDSYEKFKSLI